MANRCQSGGSKLRKIARPVISSDVMGNRNVEVRAVGAWVQCESDVCHSEAVLSAKEEETRLQLIQQAKTANLRRFQEDVKRRVKALDKAKKQQQTEKNYQTLEYEHRVVGQSAFPRAIPTPRTDSCVMRAEKPLTMRKITPSSSQGGLVNDREETNYKQFQEHTNEIHQFTTQARKRLGSRQILSEEYIHDDLPGGMWKISKTRDHPIARSGYEFEGIEDGDDLSEKMEDIRLVEGSCEEEKENPSKMKMVHFELDSEPKETRLGGIQTSAPEISGTEIIRNMPIVKVPNIYAGVQCEEEKQRQKNQHALFRRLFMDIEREQVKDNIRRREHRKRIQRLKKDKEDERRKAEHLSQELVAPRDPITGETPGQVIAREKEEKKLIKETMKDYEERRKRAKETERYVLALKHQLKEKVCNRGIELPPLCCCGETVWDTNPLTCANNCIFYRNPKGYARALQSLLMSSELA